MTAATETAAPEDTADVLARRGAAETALNQLSKLADGGMTSLSGVVAQLDAALHPVPFQAPRPGRAVLRCRGCGLAVHAEDLRWWPWPSGSLRPLPRVGCATCVGPTKLRKSR